MKAGGRPVKRDRRHAARRAARTAVSSRFVVLTGVSGSGKSQAMRALEDLGYFCVDNLPVMLLPTLAEAGQLLPLAPDSIDGLATLGERVRPPRLAEPANENTVGGIQEQHLDLMTVRAHLIDHREHVLEELAFPEIDPEGDAGDPLPEALTELEKLRHQDRGQVVDAVEAEIFEDADRRGLSRPG